MAVPFFLILLSFLAFCPLISKPLQVKSASTSTLLINAETGAILYQKDAHKRSYPASLTKIATALYVLHELERRGGSLNQKVQASPNALMTFLNPTSATSSYCLDRTGSSIGLKKGEIISLEDLVYGLLLASGNDAANVLAESVGEGSIEQFMHRLNLFLQEQGALHTHFVNPHGLHHQNHWSTAYDLGLIARLALKHPLIQQIVKTTQRSCPKTNKQHSRLFIQTNKLLKPGPHFYSKAIGIKTGYTSQAKYNLISAAVDRGRILIAVTLGYSNSCQMFSEATQLFEAAFAEIPISRLLFAKGDNHFFFTVSGGKTRLEAMLKENLSVQYYPAEEPLFQAHIDWQIPPLPIPQGKCVGNLKLLDERGTLLKELPLFASREVEQTRYAYLKETLIQYGIPLKGSFFLLLVLLLLLKFLRSKKSLSGKGLP